MKLTNLFAQALFGGAVAMLGGCASGNIGIPAGAPSLSQSRNYQVSGIRREIESECLRAPPRREGTQGGTAAQSQVGASRTGNGGFSAEYDQTRRNQLVTAYMYAVDQAYNDYERDLLELIRRDALGASTLSIMLSTLASSIEGHADFVRSLSAANTVVTGTTAAIGRDYLLNQTLNTMLTQMRANRGRQRALILGRLRNTITDWPICVALSDALAFEQAGTLTEALVRTNEAAATENRAADQAVRDAVPTITFNRAPPALALREYIGTNPAIAPLRRAKAESALVALQTARTIPTLQQSPMQRLIQLLLGSESDEVRRALINALLTSPDTSIRETDVEARQILERGLVVSNGTN